MNLVRVLCFAWLVGVFFATTGLSPTPAWAQDDRGKAIQLITDANAHYEAGEFREALLDYRKAYDITEDPRVLYRIGLTYENLANYQRAREHLELFLLAEPNTQYAERVNTKIENLKKLEASLQSSIDVTSTPPGANVYLYDDSGRPVGVTPVRIPVGPGEHLLIVKPKSGEPKTETVVVEANQSVERNYELGPPAEPPTDEEVAEAPVDEEVVESTFVEPPAGTLTKVDLGPSKGMATLLWIGVALGVAITAAGVVFLGTVVLDPTPGNAGVGLGLVLMGVSGYFLMFHDWNRDLPPPASANASPGPARGASVGFRF